MKDKLKIKLFDKGRKVAIKREFQNVDIEFWETLELKDLDPQIKEAIEEYVRNCTDFSKWVD